MKQSRVWIQKILLRKIVTSLAGVSAPFTHNRGRRDDKTIYTAMANGGRHLGTTSIVSTSDVH